jgi:putative ABC transport system ATP-binding protein
MQPLIKMQNICKFYHTGTIQQKILQNVHMEVFPHELVAIMGASGSGKSTLMNIIGLLDKPTSGEYFLNGKNVTKFSDDTLADLRNKTIGFIFQSFFLLPRLTILENITLPLYYRGAPEKDANEKGLIMLEKVGLPDFAKRKPHQLSGGQQQRAAIARALIGNPGFIIADEPTGALDTKIGQMIMDMFIDLNKNEKVTMIIVTHDPHIASQCQRTLRIQDGVIG